MALRSPRCAFAPCAARCRRPFVCCSHTPKVTSLPKGQGFGMPGPATPGSLSRGRFSFCRLARRCCVFPVVSPGCRGREVACDLGAGWGWAGLPASCQSCAQGKSLPLFKYNCFGPDPACAWISESRYQPSREKNTAAAFPPPPPTFFFPSSQSQADFFFFFFFLQAYASASLPSPPQEGSSRGDLPCEGSPR